MEVSEVFYRKGFFFSRLVLTNEAANFLKEQEGAFRDKGQWLYWRLLSKNGKHEDRIEISLRVYPVYIESEAGITIAREIEKRYNLAYCYLETIEYRWGCKLSLYCNNTFDELVKAPETLTEAGNKLCKAISKYTGESEEKVLKKAGLA